MLYYIRKRIQHRPLFSYIVRFEPLRDTTTDLLDFLFLLFHRCHTMAMHTKEYDPLPRGSDDESSLDIPHLRPHRRRFTPWSWSIVLTVLLAISVTSNLFIVLRNVKQRVLTEADCPSTYG